MSTARPELHVLRQGHGDPVVLLHGFPLDHRMWSDVAAVLPGDAPILAPDLPGLGTGPVPGAEPSVDVAADAVADLLDATGARRAVVVGLSMGGYVALALAERRPDLVAGLGLVDTKSTADTREARENRWRIADEVAQAQTVDAVLGMPQNLLGTSSRQTRPELVARITAWIGDQSPDGIAWSQRAMAGRPDRTHVLVGFGGPVCVVVGAEDTVTPRTDAEHMVGASRAARLVQVEGAGHLSAVENPAPVAAVLAQLAAQALA
ncbi:alpha/beta fold hydrolase [Cellulosimicrobium arenosum]|uniref:Alpha/beta fold hydrolase n=1 Tax=Cellulosimicrobium arenosum TaxID=2708133 RepID=A0A927J1L1_9MICO|nr:alpha/beta hydrolase [Cellulosimicrobium arenosum]MBD8080115.1 alpha/beta fold hydrolase [Cellulosimicrobium arenosum]